MINYRGIVEKRIGRKLLSSEIVHHKDGDTHNNQDNNLVITSRSKHAKIPRISQRNWNKNNIELLKLLNKADEGSLYQCLNIIFTKRQNNIIIKKLLKRSLSKTEREYYSRTIKKKLVAIVHPELPKAAWTCLL